MGLQIDFDVVLVNNIKIRWMTKNKRKVNESIYKKKQSLFFERFESIVLSALEFQNLTLKWHIELKQHLIFLWMFLCYCAQFRKTWLYGQFYELYNRILLSSEDNNLILRELNKGMIFHCLLFFRNTLSAYFSRINSCCSKLILEYDHLKKIRNKYS